MRHQFKKVAKYLYRLRYFLLLALERCVGACNSYLNQSRNNVFVQHIDFSSCKNLWSVWHVIKKLNKIYKANNSKHINDQLCGRYRCVPTIAITKAINVTMFGVPWRPMAHRRGRSVNENETRPSTNRKD